MRKAWHHLGSSVGWDNTARGATVTIEVRGRMTSYLPPRSPLYTVVLALRAADTAAKLGSSLLPPATRAARRLPSRVCG